MAEEEKNSFTKLQELKNKVIELRERSRGGGVPAGDRAEEHRGGGRGEGGCHAEDRGAHRQNKRLAEEERAKAIKETKVSSRT